LVGSELEVLAGHHREYQGRHEDLHIETVDQGQVGAVEPAPDGADADDGKNRENDVDDGEQHQQMGSEGCLNVVTGGRIQWSSPSRYSQRPCSRTKRLVSCSLPGRPRSRKLAMNSTLPSLSPWSPAWTLQMVSPIQRSAGGNSSVSGRVLGCQVCSK